MASLEHELEHPKKRRRREILRMPVSARLAFDDTVQGNTAIVPRRLWSSLTGTELDNQSSTFIALTPRSPLHAELQESIWTVLPAQPQNNHSTPEPHEQSDVIKLSPSSFACQSLLKTYSAIDRDRHPGHVPKSIEIRAIHAKPLSLETIYVSVEKNLLAKVDDIQAKFGGGFQHGKNSKKHNLANGVLQNVPAYMSRLTTLVREALCRIPIVHSGDVFSLPLPAHPITHVRPAPAIVVECEPVSQGQISEKTKIVLIQTGSSQEKALKRLAPVHPIIEESLEDTAEDTSNDQFFSAAEDGQAETGSDGDDMTDEHSDSDGAAKDQSDEDSDSMDDMISLSAPGLPPQQAGTLSAMTAATPRPGGKRATGMHTPGSLYSSFTSATARAGNRPGKVFRTEALLRKVPTELMHPKPGSDEDDESFVFIDTSMLAKIGCFSGDWVRIEVARNVSAHGFAPSVMRSLSGLANDEESDWRTVKVFGISGLSNQQPRYAVDKKGDRRPSLSQRDLMMPFSPAIYLSPILLANLNNAQFVKVGALPSPPKTSQVPRSGIPKSPPLAREVQFSKIADPTTTNLSLQSTLFLSLKHYLESRKRKLKKGDLIAVPVDQELGKAISSTSSDENAGDEETITKLNTPGSVGSRRFALAWFSVEHIEVEQTDGGNQREENTWGGVATLDSSQARVSQSGSSVQSVSHLTEIWSRYWFGIQKLGRGGIHKVDHIATAADIPAPERLPLEKRLSNLISAAVSIRAASLGLPPLVILLHSSQRQVGKSYIAGSSCSAAGVHTFPISVHDLLSENASTTGGGDVKTEALLRTRAERALSGGSQQTAILIQHIDALTADRMVPTLQDIVSWSRVLIATTSKIDDIPQGIRSLFSHEFEVTAPDETAREIILRNACVSTSTPLSSTVNLKSVALQTAALVAGDLVDVVNRASLARQSRLLSLAESQSCGLSDIYISGGEAAAYLLASDFSSAISAARSTFSDAIGAPKIPTVTWQDVGGLSSQKDAIMETISLPLTHPELFANGIRKRSGILFYGPPGTGKTLLAKAIATEFSLNFFSVKGPELLNMYIGESEANVRRVFQRARDARPCVVFFDELDSVAPKRGNQGDSGGVMDRIVSQLLAELDGMSSSGDGGEDSDGKTSSNAGGVFVIGATNRPDLLDPALLRPGRFDKMLYLGVADTHDQQHTILKALTRKFTLAPDVDLERVASRLPFTYTGADLYALCSDAMLKAITRKTRAVDDKVQQISKTRGEEISTGYFFDHLATDEDVQVVVSEEDFSAAQNELVGSVSKKELEHFERIRNMFEEQDITLGPGSQEGVKNTSKRNGVSASAGAKKAEQAKLPMRPTPAAHNSNTNVEARVSPSEDQDQDQTTATTTTTEQPAPMVQNRVKGKGIGMQRQNTASYIGAYPASSTHTHTYKQAARIGNPDSGNSSDADADDDDYGVSMSHLNGAATNGTSISSAGINSGGKGKGKGKGKVKERMMTPPANSVDGDGDGVDGFFDDVEGDDEDLYDD
ncbi:peroxisomal assembly protein [Exophiala xenobiotica]|nr:peroxisomal assembly protein [Exophiala xenobiotica]KAK5393167.1 peroxisomal assembly protein [Exophiala xenobiotica]KAK5408202.1 peroxisomal assembly protein [Exophiala xenobiotica]KAK5456388.1 peroxisomal assembly protein [Exophiala xenobiotica]KAK5472290.1 peroxisomal assembly protein [Exophiala xenobiotica]